MAPKNKFAKEEVIDAALWVVQTKGSDALTAKAVADRLGVSTRPIFSYFDTMEQLKTQVVLAAERLWNRYVQAGLQEKIPFYGFGMQYIRFAREEPQLYRLLFLEKTAGGNSRAFETMCRAMEVVRPQLVEIYHISEADAERYFRDMWLVVYSLAALIVTGGCPYSEEEIGRILTGFSVSICKAIKEIPGFTAGSFDRDDIFRGLIGQP